MVYIMTVLNLNIHFADLIGIFVIYIIKNFKGGYLTGENYFSLESF